MKKIKKIAYILVPIILVIIIFIIVFKEDNRTYAEYQKIEHKIKNCLDCNTNKIN